MPCGFYAATGGSVFGLDEAETGGQPPWNYPERGGFPPGQEGSGQGSPRSTDGLHNTTRKELLVVKSVVHELFMRCAVPANFH